ncbi:putative HNHc nuclease, partial [Staphylococcus aureus]|uniref:putative HNHc nuclease n=1 Tax=Staphylococcus aureus TaxID=1280 RepID=UPI0021BB9B08
SKLLSEDKALLYWATINRNCVICGKPHADLAHYEARQRHEQKQNESLRQTCVSAMSRTSQRATCDWR